MLILICILFFGVFFFIHENLKPISNIKDDFKEVIIEDNWYGKKVLNYLEDEKIIKNGDIAYYYVRFKNIKTDFKAGRYVIDRSKNLEEIIQYLSDGKNAIQDTVTVRLIEGYRLKDYASIIADNTNLNYEDLLNYWNNDEIIKDVFFKDYPFLTNDLLNNDVKFDLEGYLFPDTYEFFYETSNEEVTRKLLDNTLDIYNKYLEDINSSEYSVNQIFTLASIIQRESSNVDDMKDIASVFYNRLNIGMQLQSSVTVCYSLDIGINGDWAKCEITQDHFDPYNTYQIIGFPPGPICAFNEYALEAALNPNITDYYFFIGDVCDSGETIFAKTYAEQLENQSRYLTCY